MKSPEQSMGNEQPKRIGKERDAFMNEMNIPSFDDFLREKGISPEDEKISVYIEIWNTAVKAACDYFGNQEGVDNGAAEALLVPEQTNE